MEDKTEHLPERSRFYDLEPIGIGTIDVESFSGYISRLAQEHLVTPVILIKNSTEQSKHLPQVFAQNSIPARTAANLNGFSETSEKLVEMFRKATFRQDIQRTTLMAWKNKISSHGLLKKHLAWCPICFQEQLSKSEIIYEKLIWTFEVVKICLLHQIELSESCPHCKNRMNVLSGKSRPGFCSKCLRWLGLKTVPDNAAKDSKKFWITQSVSSFLLVNPPILDLFSANLNDLIQQTTNGNINDFAHFTGVWHLAIRRLLKSEVLPTLEMMIDICHPLKTSITNLFIENNKTFPAKNNCKYIVEKPLTKEEVKIKLAEYINESPPLSANEIARRVGWQTTRFQRNFSVEYKLVVEAYLQHQADKLPNYTDEQIKEVLIQASSEIPPPSLQSVFRRIGCRSTGYRFYSKFPELCKKISSRYKNTNKKDFDLGIAKQLLESAIKEKPIPSFSEVARRLKCSRTTLSKKLPVLSARFQQKYQSDLKTIRNKNRQEMFREIVGAIQKLQDHRKPITENAVKKLLKRKWNDTNFKKAYRELRLKN